MEERVAYTVIFFNNFVVSLQLVEIHIIHLVLMNGESEEMVECFINQYCILLTVSLLLIIINHNGNIAVQLNRVI